MSSSGRGQGSQSKPQPVEPPVSLTPDFMGFHLDTMIEARQPSVQPSSPVFMGPTPQRGPSGNEAPCTYTEEEPFLIREQANAVSKATHAKPEGGQWWRTQDEFKLSVLRDTGAKESWKGNQAAYNSDGEREPRCGRALESRHHDLYTRNESVDPQEERIVAVDDPNSPPNPPRPRWSEEEDKLLLELRDSKTIWKNIAARLPGRSDQACRQRFGHLGRPTPNEV